MAQTKTVSLIGLEPAELQWIRTLVALLRHPDPNIGELSRQALIYLSETAGMRETLQSGPLDYAG